MFKLITALCFSIVLSFTVFAQDDNDDEYNKNEFYIGYSNQQNDRFGRSTFHGAEGAYTRNVHRWFGIRADVSYAKNDRTLAGTLFDPVSGTTYNFQQTNNRSVTNILGGIQVKDNASKKRFKPFGYALAGVAISRNTFKDLACTSATCPPTIPIFNNVTFRDTRFAGAFGGGIDIRINRRIDFRAIQIDYNPIFTSSGVENNFRIGIGIVFK